MQSIITKYHGPGNVRGARISATATGGIGRYYPYDHAVTADCNHRFAAIRLAEELNWSGHWVGGVLNDKGAEIWVREWEDKRDSFDVADPSPA